MNFIDYLGFLAGILVIGSLIPQIVKSWKTKKTRDLSLARYCIYVTGIILWLIYGIALKSPPLIFSNIVALFFASIILYLKLKYG